MFVFKCLQAVVFAVLGLLAVLAARQIGSDSLEPRFQLLLGMMVMFSLFIGANALERTESFKAWWKEVCGEELQAHEEPRPASDQTKKNADIAIVALCAMLVLYLLAPRFSHFDDLQMTLSIAGGVACTIGFWLFLRYQSFKEKYGGAFVGLFFGLCVILAPAPLWTDIVLVPVFVVIGHWVGGWWFKQPWVGQARREAEWRAQQEASAKHAADVAAADAALATASSPPAPPPPITEPSALAKNIADELFRKS
jgi:hypothetical protein